MIFEKKSICVIVPLDPAEGARYTKPVRNEDSDDELDCIYQIMVQDQDWVNPTADGRISWEHDSSCMLDSNEEIERWQNRLHEVTTLNYNMMIRSLQHMMTEARKLPADDGATNGKEFVDQCGNTITKQKRHGVQKGALHVTTTQGWSTPQKTRRNRCENRRWLHVQFGGPQWRMRSGQQGRSRLGTHLQ